MKKITTTTNFSLFSTKEYYREYLAQMSEENQELLNFYHEVFGEIKPTKNMVVIGGSLSPYHLISASKKLENIVFTDYLKTNRTAVEMWLRNHPDSYSWDNFFHYVASLEHEKVTKENVQKLKDRTNEKIKQVIKSDLKKENPLDPELFEPFDVVSVTSCPEAITDKEEEFILYQERIDKMVKKNGLLVQFFCKEMNYWKNGDHYFPGYYVTDDSVKKMYKKIGYEIVAFNSTTQPESELLGYGGITMIAGRKK